MMNIAGIIAEYNPFHTGHAYQIAQTRAALGAETAVVVAMSGNWVQGADCAIADKWTRTGLALSGGADLVLELPTAWAVSSAERFARGGVAVLHATGIVTHLSFGSEGGEVGPLARVADCLDTEIYQAGLRRFLDEGMSFPACRQAVVRALLGEADAAVLDRANNNLGVEYLRALRALNSSIQPMTVRREGGGHGSRGTAEAPPRFTSATDVRGLLLSEDWAQAERYLLPGALKTLQDGGLVTERAAAGCQSMFLARLRTMTAEDWAALPDSGAAEGLPERLVRAGRQAATTETFFQLAKTKRYTHARLRRLLIYALLGLTEESRTDLPPYLRVLGCNERGRGLLREMKTKATLPVVTKPAHARALSPEGLQVFEQESRCTDLYGLFFQPPRPGGLEWTTGPVVL